MSGLSGVRDRLEADVEQGRIPGCQLFVRYRGEVVADLACGEARPGVPMQRDSLALWLCCTKAVTAIAAGQQIERGRIRLDDTVGHHLSGFPAPPESEVRVKDLLTHTSGLPDEPLMAHLEEPWDTIVEHFPTLRVRNGHCVGEQVRYSNMTGLFIVGELVRRCDGRSFDRYVREEIFQPLGLDNCWIGMDHATYEAVEHRLVGMFGVSQWKEETLDNFHSPALVENARPDFGGRGPMRELGLLWSSLCDIRRGSEGGLVSPETLAVLLEPQVKTHDRAFDRAITWGHGLTLGGDFFGASGDMVFGHRGAEVATLLADPEEDLVIALGINLLTNERADYVRHEGLVAAIHAELDLGSTGV